MDLIVPFFDFKENKNRTLEITPNRGHDGVMGAPEPSVAFLLEGSVSCTYSFPARSTTGEIGSEK